MASLEDLPGTAAEILTLFDTQLAAQGVTLPDRRYVAPGSAIPWDGEQLVVCLQSIDQGEPGMPVATNFSPSVTHFAAQFAVAIVREVPALTGDGPIGAMLPTEEDLGIAGSSAMADAAALVKAAVEIHASYGLTGPGESFVIGPCMAVGPDGGLAGHRLLVTVSLA